jgi:hypothetical protein
MKKIRILLLIALLASSVSVFAWSPARRTYRRPGNCVSVPLDGALLALLGAAGVSYFLIRRKRNKKEQ